VSRYPLLFLALSAPGFCQGLQFGLKAGIPLTEYFEAGVENGGLHGGANYSAATRRYTLGASLERRLAGGLGLEIDLLYHRMGYVGIVNYFDSATGSFHASAINVNGASWDFPLMAKYRFGGAIHPYVVGGGVLRYVGPIRGHGTETEGSLVSQTSSTSPLDTTQPSELRKRFYPGVTAGGGVEVRAGRVRVLPELRYTRWTANISSGPGEGLRFAPNQIEFLVGVRF
jgi:hypothetical protein